MNDIMTFLTFYPWVSILYLGLFSLAVGSLLNVIIHRLPLMLQAEWRTDCCELLSLPEPLKKQFNLFFPRSFCPSCKTTIPAWHNIPILSYCFLLGRCRQCKTSISLQYPFVELLTLTLSLIAAWHFGFHLSLLYALAFIWTLIVLFFIDLKHQILPDCLTLGLLWLGLFANVNALFVTLPIAVLSAAGAYFSLWLFIRLFYYATGKIGMGNGDFKLFAAFGAWFGWTSLPFILISASLAGAIIGTVILKCHKKSKDTPIPFGPYLCASGLVTLFYGQAIIERYLNHVLITL